jgi:hypothetical protein
LAVFSISPSLPDFGHWVNLFAERTKRFGRENSFNGKVEEACQFEDEFQGGDIVSAFEETDGLGVDPDLASEHLPGQGTLRTENGDAVENHMLIIKQQFVIDTQYLQILLESAREAPASLEPSCDQVSIDEFRPTHSLSMDSSSLGGSVRKMPQGPGIGRAVLPRDNSANR